MKRKRFSNKFFTLIMSILLMLSIPVQALASTAPYGTGGAGANPFNPRGYSIVEGGKQVWLQSNYIHNAPSGNNLVAAWSDTATGQYYVTSGDKQMYAWLDKGQLTNGFNMPYLRGFTTDPTVDVRYFFVVSINDGPFVSVPYAEAAANNLKDSNGNIDATQGLSAFGYANRNLSDPDGNPPGGWVYPLNFTLKPGTKYTFAFLRGFAANNGMSLILSKDTTADGQSGIAGVLQNSALTDAEKAEWAAHYQDMYQFAKTFTDLGLGVNTGKEVYNVDFKDFYHTLQTYADLTALNSKLTEATTFANSVTDNDYKLGNYRKASVQALQTLIDQINANTTLNQELQTSVDALTNQLSDALNYAKEPAILVKGVTLDKNRADINLGDTLTLKATVSPENADDPTITWTSSNNQVATVENGVVTAVSPGDVTISATTADGGYVATCAIEVKKPAVLVKGVTLDKNSADINLGDTLTLKATVSPENADNPTITWASSNNQVATVENGVVKAVSAGDVTISATTADGGYVATCAIKVNNLNKSVTGTNSSVAVDYNTSALPAGISVGSVKNIVVTSGPDKTSIENGLSKIGYTNLLINDVQLLDLDGKPITSLLGNVTVKIKIPDGAANEALSVFWYNPATGKLTNMNATKQNGYLIFATNHFSYYVVAKANASTTPSENAGKAHNGAVGVDKNTSTSSIANPKTSDNSTSPIPFGIAAGLAIAVLIVMQQYRRRKNQA